MARERKESSLQEKKLMLKLVCQGKTYREVAAIVGKSWSTVYYTVKKFKSCGFLGNKRGRGRKSILSARNENFIIEKIKANPKACLTELTQEVSTIVQKPISVETIRRVLRRKEFHGRVSRKKPFISKVNKAKRLEFAQKYGSKDPKFWKKVLFTDESKFNIFGSDGRQLVWRKDKTAMDKKHLTPTVKHGGGNVMVWGCMAASGAGQLVFIDDIMNKDIYLNILRRNLKPSVRQLQLPERYYFQQDNDPKHTAHIVQEWLHLNVPNQLHTPPQSPDLNPIEHLWDEMGRQLSKEAVTSKTMLKQKILQLWTSMSSDITNKLVESMPRRLQAVIAAKGYPTSY